MKLLQQRDLSSEARLAARLRLSEKRILQSTLDAVRRCFANDCPRSEELSNIGYILRLLAS